MNKYNIIRYIRSQNPARTATALRWRRYSSEAGSSGDDVVIPPYIPRGRTDILQALAATVGRDPTAPHYKFHDDPYLIPMNNYKKRIYALSQESGRKAAMWVRQQHPDLFKFTVWDPPMKMLTPYKNADPPIEAYIPKPEYTETSKVTEEDLKTLIRNSFVKDAKFVYKLLEAQAPDSISAETQQKFLELLCFYNEEDPLPEELLEEKWFRQSTFNDKTQKVSVLWKDSSLANTLFDKMENKTPEAYCSMIQGMCKYFQASKAYSLYEECREKGVQLNTDSYNGLLSVTGFLKESNELRWQLILDLLKDINDQGLSPNVGTLNSILETIVLMASPKGKEYATQTIAELVNRCGVKPSLASWYHMLNIFCSDRRNKNYMLHNVMDSLEGQNLSIQDSKDIYFFVTAMKICHLHLKDVNLAKRVHKLLLTGLNYNLIGDAHLESIYYRHYFSLVCQMENFDDFINIYNELVPHVYVPETSVMEEFVRVLDANIACEHYPLFWSHIVMFGHNSRDSILQFFLTSMVRNCPPETKEEPMETAADPTIETKSLVPKEMAPNVSLGRALNAGLVEVRKRFEIIEPVRSIEEEFATIAWDIWTKVENQPEGRVKRLTLTGAMLGDIIALLVRVNRLDEAHTVVQKLNNIEEVSGVPLTADPLISFTRKAIKDNKPSYAANALKYLSECGFTEATAEAKVALQSLLNKSQAEVEEVVKNAAARNTETWTDDKNVATLLAIVNEESSNKTKSSRRNIENEEDQDSSDSSDSSDGESNVDHLIRKSKK